MLGLGIRLTNASAPVEQIKDSGTWSITSLNDLPNTQYVGVLAFFTSEDLIAASDYDTNTPLAAGNRINYTDGTPITVSVTFRRMASTASDAAVLEDSTGTAYLYRFNASASASNVASFYLSPVNQTSQTVAELYGDSGSGTFNFTTFGGENITDGAGDDVYRLFVEFSNSGFTSASALSSAFTLTTV